MESLGNIIGGAIAIVIVGVIIFISKAVENKNGNQGFLGALKSVIRVLIKILAVLLLIVAVGLVIAMFVVQR